MEAQNLGSDTPKGPFIFKERCHLKLSQKNMDDKVLSSSQLITVSNSLGLIACAVHEGILLIATSDVHRQISQTENRHLPSELSTTNILLPRYRIPTFLSFSKDSSYLAVADDNIVDIYQTKDLSKDTAPVRHCTESKIIVFTWKGDDTFSVVESNGLLTVLKTECGKTETRAKIIPRSFFWTRNSTFDNICSAGWSPDGNYLAVGKKEGKIEIYREDNFQNIAFSIELAHKTDIVQISWFSPTDILFSLLMPSLSDSSKLLITPLVAPIYTSQKEMIMEEDIINCSEAFPFSEDDGRKRTIYVEYLESWQALVMSSSDYAKVAILKKSTVTSLWNLVEIEEKYHCNVRLLNDQYIESFPLGIAVDLTNEENIPHKFEKEIFYPSSPLILVITSDTVLHIYSLINVETKTPYPRITSSRTSRKNPPNVFEFLKKYYMPLTPRTAALRLQCNDDNKLFHFRIPIISRSLVKKILSAVLQETQENENISISEGVEAYDLLQSRNKLVYEYVENLKSSGGTIDQELKRRVNERDQAEFVCHEKLTHTLSLIEKFIDEENKENSADSISFEEFVNQLQKMIEDRNMANAQSLTEMSQNRTQVAEMLESIRNVKEARNLKDKLETLEDEIWKKKEERQRVENQARNIRRSSKYHAEIKTNLAFFEDEIRVMEIELNNLEKEFNRVKHLFPEIEIYSDE